MSESGRGFRGKLARKNNMFLPDFRSHDDEFPRISRGYDTFCTHAAGHVHASHPEGRGCILLVRSWGTITRLRRFSTRAKDLYKILHQVLKKERSLE